MNSDDFSLVSVIKFADGSIEAQRLHRGDKESCVKTAQLLDALSYSGGKQVKSGGVVWMPTSEWEAAKNPA